MSAVLVTGLTAKQNLPFLPQRWQKPSPVLTARRDGQAEKYRDVDSDTRVFIGHNLRMTKNKRLFGCDLMSISSAQHDDSKNTVNLNVAKIYLVSYY